MSLNPGNAHCPYCGRLFCGGSCMASVMQRQANMSALLAAAQANVPNQANALNAGYFNGFPSPPQVLSPPQPIENAGIKVEDLIGWRIWSLSPSGLLKSFAFDRVWLPGEPMEGNPGDHNSEGVWAFFNEAQAAEKLSKSPNHVMGSVRLWGQVIEHEHGYRAQYARIVSIDAVHLPGKFPWDIEVERALTWLRGKYGLPERDRTQHLDPPL